MAASPPRSRGSRPAPRSAAADGGYEQWPYLDEEVLTASRSSKVCLTCHWFRHHAGVNCIPLLTCQLHQGLLAHGEHLTRRCQGWTDDMTRQRWWGCCPMKGTVTTCKAPRTWIWPCSRAWARLASFRRKLTPFATQPLRQCFWRTDDPAAFLPGFEGLDLAPS